MKYNWSKEQIEAIYKSIEMWTKLAETGEEKGSVVAGFTGGGYDNLHWGCHLCQYVKEKIGYAHSAGSECFECCPFAIAKGALCVESQTSFDKWLTAKNTDAKKRYAEAFLGDLYSLVPLEKGDRVTAAIDTYDHWGKFGSFDECKNGDYWVDWDDGGHSYAPTRAGLRHAWDEPEKKAAPKRIKYIYVAGALSTLPSDKIDGRSPSRVVTDYLNNASSMIAAAHEMINWGFDVVPYVPALDMLLGIWGGNVTETQYRAMSSAWLEKCDALVVVSQSRGVEAEIEKAKELGITVFNSMYNLLKALEAQI